MAMTRNARALEGEEEEEGEKEEEEEAAGDGEGRAGPTPWPGGPGALPRVPGRAGSMKAGHGGKQQLHSLASSAPNNSFRIQKCFKSLSSTVPVTRPRARRRRPTQ